MNVEEFDITLLRTLVVVPCALGLLQENQTLKHLKCDVSSPSRKDNLLEEELNNQRILESVKRKTLRKQKNQQVKTNLEVDGCFGRSPNPGGRLKFSPANFTCQSRGRLPYFDCLTCLEKLELPNVLGDFGCRSSHGYCTGVHSIIFLVVCYLVGVRM